MSTENERVGGAQARPECRWCGEDLRQDQRGAWVDVFETIFCDHPLHTYHEVAS